MQAIWRVLAIYLLLYETAGAQEHHLAHRLFCRRHCALPPSTVTGTVVLRIWPSSPVTKQIPLRGATLDSVLVGPDLNSVGLSLLLAARDRPSILQDEDANRAAVFFRIGTPDIVAIVRQNRVFAFPRVMLLHPQIRNLQVRNGDVLVTIKSDMGARPDPRTGELLPASDPMITLLLPPVSNPRSHEPTKVAVRLYGPLMPPEAAGIQSEEDSVPWSIMLDEHVEQIGEPHGGTLSDSATPIFVLRHGSGTYIIPERSSGLFRQDGPLFQLLAAGKVDSADPVAVPGGSNLWTILINPFRQMLLVDGDSIEATDLAIFIATDPFFLGR